MRGEWRAAGPIAPRWRRSLLHEHLVLPEPAGNEWPAHAVRCEIEGLLKVSPADARIGEYGQLTYILQC